MFPTLLEEPTYESVRRQATPGKIHHCSKCSSFRNAGSHCGLMENQSF
uniref:Uncharacterized protein n=1 Tax=Anguilla anguilla TaxID=7936 RepID=A0A0E9TKK5_ANGAN